MTTDYRLDPFQDVLNTVNISGEMHTVPSVSPFTIRLAEVPLKETPSSISLTIGGLVASEVSAQPAAGEFWPDYSTGADGDDNWNTGTILFNALDAGKKIVAAYRGTGTLAAAKETSQVFYFDVSGSITAPPWARFVILTGCGGGGGGGGGSTANTSTVGQGGSGGYGGQCIEVTKDVTPGATYAITIGTSGAAGTAGANGHAGGTTSFGDLLSLGGGGGGAVGKVGSEGAGGLNGSSLYNGSGAFGAAGARRVTYGVGNAGSGRGCPGSGGYGYSSARYAGGAGRSGLLIVKWVA